MCLDKQYKNERKDLIKFFDNVLRSEHMKGKIAKKFRKF